MPYPTNSLDNLFLTLAISLVSIASPITLIDLYPESTKSDKSAALVEPPDRGTRTPRAGEVIV